MVVELFDQVDKLGGFDVDAVADCNVLGLVDMDVDQYQGSHEVVKDRYRISTS